MASVNDTVSSASASPKSSRPTFAPWRFSLRFMLFLMVLAGVVFAWQRDRQALLRRILQLEEEKALAELKANAPSWGVAQLLGPPDTQFAGDIPTSWASATQDGQAEWLLLEYMREVKAAGVEVHETYNPGALTKVCAVDDAGNETVLWEGTDPTPATAPRGISTIPLNSTIKTRRIKIYLDSPSFLGWNEIDAVGLIDPSGNVQWAVDAEASSTYGGGNVMLGGLLPQLGGGTVKIIPTQ